MPWKEPGDKPWAGQNRAENAEVFIPVGAQERVYRGRVILDGQWVHVQTEVERMSFPIGCVSGVRWDFLDV